jgi:hypothetical protein
MSHTGKKKQSAKAAKAEFESVIRVLEKDNQALKTPPTQGNFHLPFTSTNIHICHFFFNHLFHLCLLAAIFWASAVLVPSIPIGLYFTPIFDANPVDFAVVFIAALVISIPLLGLSYDLVASKTRKNLFKSR